MGTMSKDNGRWQGHFDVCIEIGDLLSLFPSVYGQLLKVEKYTYKVYNIDLISREDVEV